MTTVSASRRRGVRRLDPYAAAWGGVIGAIGLMAGSGLGLPARFIVIGLTFAIAGVAAGLRAIANRQINATAAWVVAHLLALAFVTLSAVASLITGPAAPSLTPGGLSATVASALIGLFAALLGAVVTDHWLRPRKTRGYGSKLR